MFTFTAPMPGTLATAFSTMFVCSCAEGQFGVVKVFVMRQVSFDEPVVQVTAPAGGGPPGFAFSTEGPFAQHLMQLGKPLQREEFLAYASEYPEFKTFDEGGVEFLIPLVNVASDSGKDLKGVLCLGPKIGNRPYGETDRTLGRVLGDMVAISLHNAQLYHRSIVDGLTQVYSRGHFDVHLIEHRQHIFQLLGRDFIRFRGFIDLVKIQNSLIFQGHNSFLFKFFVMSPYVPAQSVMKTLSDPLFGACEVVGSGPSCLRIKNSIMPHHPVPLPP